MTESNRPIFPHPYQIIAQQLGGKKFQAMTGAKDFVGSGNCLTFKLPGKSFAKHDINMVKIELTPMDVYTVTFYHTRAGKLTTVVTREDVYAEDLQATFTQETGLETHL